MFIHTTPKNEQQLVSKLPTGFTVLLESSENHSYVWHCSTLRFPCYRGGFSTQPHQGSKGALHSRWSCTVTGLLVDMKKELAGLGWPLPSFKFSALSIPPEYFIWILIMDLFLLLYFRYLKIGQYHTCFFFFFKFNCMQWNWTHTTLKATFCARREERTGLHVAQERHTNPLW